MGGRGQRGDGGHRGPGHDGDGGGLFPVIGSTENQTSTLCSHLLLETEESDHESGESDRIELDLDPALLTCRERGQEPCYLTLISIESSPGLSCTHPLIGLNPQKRVVLKSSLTDLMNLQDSKYY